MSDPRQIVNAQIGSTWHGEYDPYKQYPPLAEVTQNGSTYRMIALEPSVGQPLPVWPATQTAYWALAARRGWDGQLLTGAMEFDAATGSLVFVTLDGYDAYGGPTFEINPASGYLEVIVNG